MNAAILAVGSELLSTDRLDTNSLRLAEILERFGVELVGKAVVGDDEARIATELERMLTEVELVLVTGGLGPTADDVTRAAVARALRREIEVDEDVVAGIEQKFQSLGLEMPAVNRRQGEVIEGAELLGNRRGTAPGMRLTEASSTLFLLPGVPNELDGMIEAHLIPWLHGHASGEMRERRTLKVASLPESTVEERIAPAYEEYGRESIAVLARPGEIRVRFEARGSEAERRRRLDAMEARLSRLIGAAVFARREEESLEGVVGTLLERAGSTLVTAESCTGGLVAERITRVPGSSAYFRGGAVTYSNALKVRLLGVPETLLETHGAVSEPVARAMAEGAREHLGADYAIAITGVAGPDGGTEDKPVGTVHLAVAGPDSTTGTHTDHRRVRFPGNRERVRRQSGQLALEMLRRRLLRVLEDEGLAGNDAVDAPIPEVRR